MVMLLSFEKLLNFIKNERMFALKAGELIEIVMFHYSIFNSLDLTEVAMVHDIDLSNCGQSCEVPFSLWNSKMHLKGRHNWMEKLERDCTWVIINQDKETKIYPKEVFHFDSNLKKKIDWKNQKILLNKSELKKVFFMKFELKCNSANQIIMHHNQVTTEFSTCIGIKVNRNLQINMVKVDVVKGKNIPELDKNKHFNCRTIDLKTSQYDILYAIVSFDGDFKPDPKRDTLYLQLRAKEIFDNFDSTRSKSRRL